MKTPEEIRSAFKMRYPDIEDDQFSLSVPALFTTPEMLKSWPATDAVRDSVSDQACEAGCLIRLARAKARRKDHWFIK